MEIILNSCDTKHPCRDLNPQPSDPCSDTLATTPRKLIKYIFATSILMSKVMPYGPPKLFHGPKEILQCTHGDHSMNP
jgi:hypothetical protein